jgi:hypothetical protein
MNVKIVFLNILILIGLFSCEKKLKDTSLEQNVHIRSEINKLTELNISIKENSKEFRELPYSFEEGYYEIYNNGTYDIVRFPYSEINKNKILNTMPGSIIGTNVGEWGGELFFRSIYGGHETYTIIKDNIVDIFRYKNGIYVLTGLSHLSISKGNIVKLKYTEEKWDVDFIIELDSCPYVKKIFEDYLYIVTSEGITVFDGNDIKEIKKGNWRYLNPQSIYINNEIIAIGLKGCIAIINKEDNKIEYFKK